MNRELGSYKTEESFYAEKVSYTSKTLDEDTGLYYFNARWYDPQLGRFLTENPARANSNWYIYASNNPIMRIDPTGLDDYVFYDPEDFSDQAKVEYDKLVDARGGDDSKVHIIIPGIDSEGNKVDFKNQWAEMVEPETVSLFGHGNETGMSLNLDDENMVNITSNESGITEGGNLAIRIQDLEKHNIDKLNIYTCNGGNVKNPNNLARSFQKNLSINEVIASDGNLSYTLNKPRVSYAGADEYRLKYGTNPKGLMSYPQGGEPKEIFNPLDWVYDARISFDAARE